MSDYDHLFKLLLIGDSGVGKTSMLLAFTTEEFTDREKPTIGVDLKVKMLSLQGKKLKLTYESVELSFALIACLNFNSQHLGYCWFVFVPVFFRFVFHSHIFKKAKRGIKHLPRLTIEELMASFWVSCLNTFFFHNILSQTVYDVTSHQSFENVQNWLKEVDIYSTNESAVKMLVGNKIDMV